MGPEPNFFRIRAFRKASEFADKYANDLGQLNNYQLKQLPGIGDALAKDIVEYSKTGKIEYYETLKKESPVKLEELTKVQGVGPKTVKKLYYQLGVTDVESLKKAAELNQIASLDGFGQKSQQSILENIKFAIVNKERARLDTALETAKNYITYLKNTDQNIINISYAGSLRRKEESVGDVDILVSSKNPKETSEIFVGYKEIEKVLGNGQTKSSVWLKQKVQVDLRVVPNESFGSAMQYFTGNVDHNVKLRKIALKKGLKLSEYGVFNQKDENLTKNTTEKEIYELLVGNYIIPEMRTDTNETDLALKNKLPKPITLKDITGDLHTHTTHSDGKNTPDQMVEKAVKLKYKYYGIADHFGNLGVANAVKEDEFNKYFEDIQRVKEKYKDKITVLIGCEANIKPNGDLDFNQKKLEKLDFVVASIHSSFKQTPPLATERYLNLLDNPVVTIIGHPTGKLVNKRPSITFNFEDVFSKAKKGGVALEINAHPMRLDLPYNLVQIALKQGCKISINTDAHSLNDLDLMKYGVYVARKAGIETKNLYLPSRL